MRMRTPRRRLLAAVAVGVLASTVAVAAVLAVVIDDEPATDGEFVLEEPGVYDEPIPTAPVIEGALPAVTLSDADGQPRPFAQFAGRPLVINVWYSTCAPCARELVDFADVSAELEGEVQFVGVDPVDDVDTMVAFADARGVTYPLLRDPDGAFVSGAAITRFPTTLFVDASGVIVHQTNEIDADDLRATIEDLFAVSDTAAGGV